MTKTENKKAIKALPALKASLRWYRKETVRQLRNRAETASSNAGRAWLHAKADKVSKAELADLRVSYTMERVSEICSAPLFELARVVPGLVRL